jgi:hypothetical protein
METLASAISNLKHNIFHAATIGGDTDLAVPARMNYP